jgi:micrococcal nuclease
LLALRRAMPGKRSVREGSSGRQTIPVDQEEPISQISGTAIFARPMVQLSCLIGVVFGTLLAVTAAAAASPSLIGQVERVVDGGTITVRIGDRTETVRYIGLDASELDRPAKRKQSAGLEAAEANRQFVEGLSVRLELDVQERDRDGRLLAYVYVGDLMVNAELVAQGLATATTVPPNVKHQELLLKLQREARLLRLGLWRGANPPPPERESPSTPPRQVAQSRPGVPPQDAWTCPLTHPIKGNFTTYSGEPCIYHMNGGEFFNKTKPERCYATEDEARQDGCRRSRR